MQHLLTIALHHDQDVVFARQKAAHVTSLLGFDVPEQTRIATAVSEIARNAFQYAGGGRVDFEFEEQAMPQRLVIRVRDNGPGIPHLAEMLDGRYQSQTGMGRGIVGARRLMDRSSIESTAAGTTVVLEKHLTSRQNPLTADRVRRLADALAETPPPASLVEEIQQQNQALLRALTELQQKQQELVRLNRELEDTNRGVAAQYAELDEKADHLRQADETESRFLSNMTHEFRTPVNAIVGLSKLLDEDRRRAGREPEPEIAYIRESAEQLSKLVDDLLDLAKLQAGKTVVRPSEFDVQKLLGTLGGMLRPLLLNESVSLVFDAPGDLVPLYTDEDKVSQILRNLLSNALKFTEHGEVRVSVTPPDRDGFIRFAVSDTGIGIAPEHQDRIFEEFFQIEHALQRHSRGTGLGLPLARRVAELLGGTLAVTSELGAGSTFTLSLPARYAPPWPEGSAADWQPEAGKVHPRNSRRRDPRHPAPGTTERRAPGGTGPAAIITNSREQRRAR